MRLLLALAALLAVACNRAPPADEPAPARDRPLAQDGTTARAITSTPDRAKIQLDLAAVRGALVIWKQEHGTYPASLAEAKVEGLNYPADLVYDAATGTVRSATYPSY